jgi:hypothetical protein
MNPLTSLVIAYEGVTDDELYSALGAALQGSSLNVAAQDRGRLARFARQWFGNKVEQVRRLVQDSETYRMWAMTAGPGQIAEASVVAEALAEQEHDQATAAVLAVQLTRDEIARSGRTYDIAVSFATSETEYVRSVVDEARALGLAVFHEPDITHEWWGRNFLVEGRRIYGQLTLRFVPFLSSAYFTDPRTRDAFTTAMITATTRGDEYILPVLVGDVPVPPELLDPFVGFLRAEDHQPHQLAAHMKNKVLAAKAREGQPQDLGAIVRDAHSVADHQSAN